MLKWQDLRSLLRRLRCLGGRPLSWEDLDAYAFPPTPLIANVINKILSHDCGRIIVIALGWPNMLWFWVLVNLSSQILLCLSPQVNLLIQPFNRSLRRDLLNLIPSESIRVQEFSGRVAEWIEAPERCSSRAVYEAKWSILCLMVQIESGWL